MEKKIAMFSLHCQPDLEKHCHNSWYLQFLKVHDRFWKISFYQKLLDCICIVIPPLTVIIDQLSRDCEIYGISFVDLSKVIIVFYILKLSLIKMQFLFSQPKSYYIPSLICYFGQNNQAKHKYKVQQYHIGRRAKQWPLKFVKNFYLNGFQLGARKFGQSKY